MRGGGIYRRGIRGEGVRVWRGGIDRVPEMDAVCRQGSCPGVEDGPIGGVHLSVGEGEAAGTSSGEVMRGE
jgi:hypothetical protein